MLTKIMSKLGWIKAAKPVAFDRTNPQAVAEAIRKAIAGEDLPGIRGVRVHTINRNTGEVNSSSVEPVETVEAEPLGSWKEYSGAMVHNTIPGWAYGRMGCQKHSNSDEIGVTYFFGNLKGDYGVFTVNMDVCYPVNIDSGAEDERDDQPVLANLVHLPTGAGLGVFETRALAAQAAEALERSGIFTSHQPIPVENWVSQRENIMTIWRFAGIDECPDRHCHPLGNPNDVPIMIQIDLDEGKPERLS